MSLLLRSAAFLLLASLLNPSAYAQGRDPKQFPELSRTISAQMEATNKANMDAMMERMNALMAAGANKENVVPPGVTPPTGGPKRPRAKKHQCPNCKKMVLHKAQDCYELEANKDKRFDGWKSAITAA